MSEIHITAIVCGISSLILFVIYTLNVTKVKKFNNMEMSLILGSLSLLNFAIAIVTGPLFNLGSYVTFLAQNTYAHIQYEIAFAIYTAVFAGYHLMLHFYEIKEFSYYPHVMMSINILSAGICGIRVVMSDAWIHVVMDIAKKLQLDEGMGRAFDDTEDLIDKALSSVLTGLKVRKNRKNIKPTKHRTPAPEAEVKLLDDIDI